MVTTTRRMLEELRRPELFDAVLDEVTRVRAEMGYPIIVTPVSQFIASQAARNVIDGERWANVSDETVRYFLGHYGEPPAPVDPDDRRPGAVAAARGQAAGPFEPITLDGARERFGARISEEELLLRLTMPEEQVDAMVAARGNVPRRRRRRGPDGAPLVTLLRELARRPSITDFDAHQRAATRWCGAVPEGPASGLDGLDGLRLDDVHGFVFDVDGTLVHRGPDGRAQPQPGAVEVLERIRASGRPLVLFTNGSHVRSETIARGAARRRPPGRRRRGADAARQRDQLSAPPPSRAAGAAVRLGRGPRADGRRRASRWPQGEEAEVVFVAHVDEIEVTDVERAARAVERGAPLLTGSYARGYAGANGIIFSRGAMITAAIAKVTGDAAAGRRQALARRRRRDRAAARGRPPRSSR